MNREERIKLVKAMEFIARQVNDEENFDYWQTMGVADGDIEYGDLSVDDWDVYLEYYIEDEHFADLMHRFLVTMYFAHKDDSGLVCDGVVSL